MNALNMDKRLSPRCGDNQRNQSRRAITSITNFSIQNSLSTKYFKSIPNNN